METKNFNQTNDLSETNQPQQNIEKCINNRKIFFLGLGFTVVLIMVGMISYYFGTQKNNSTQEIVNTISKEPSTLSQIDATLETVQPTSSPKTIIPLEKLIIDEASGWKEYINTKYNYSFKYPKTLEFSPAPMELTNAQLSTQRDISFYDPSLPSGDPGTSFTIQVNELDSKGEDKNCSDLNDCFSKSVSWLTEPVESIEITEINKTETTFLGNPAIVFDYQRKTSLYTQNWKYIYFISNEDAYNIHISSNITRKNESSDLFDTILSTFSINE